MKTLQLKNAIFEHNKIVLIRKKGNVVIAISDIVRIEYSKPTLFNYLFASTFFGGTFPGRLQIYLKNKVGKTKLYLVKIKYKDFLMIPNSYSDKICN